MQADALAEAVNGIEHARAMKTPGLGLWALRKP